MFIYIPLSYSSYAEKLITKSFEILDKGKNRGLQHEELGKSLGKEVNLLKIPKNFLIIATKLLVEKKSEYQSNKKKESQVILRKRSEKSDDPIRMYLREMGGVELLSERVKL